MVSTDKRQKLTYTPLQTGITGQYYRWLARSKLADYDTITMINGTVTSAGLAPQDSTTDAAAAANPTYTARVTHPSGEEAVLTARSIVLATGLKDDIPSSPPGLQENWGQAVFWCPWCDGHEHADQPLGILGSLADVPGLVREVSTLNTDVVAFVNGTDTPSARAAADASFAGWETYLAARNVTVYNQTLASLTRLRDGFNASMDPSLPTYPEYDLFRVDLDDGTSLERAAFFTDFPDEQRSTLARDMGVEVQWGRLAGVQSKGYLTNLPLVYAVGDNNIDNSTNVPHALYSGKRAAVYLHVALARQESTAEIAAAGNNTSSALAERGQESRIDHRDVWDRMNGSPDDFFYAGHFE